MAIYLGLGSNLGDRRENLRSALGALREAGLAVHRISPVVESPALLPPDAPPDWNNPFLNLVAECRAELAPEALLSRLKDIERALGRSDSRRWAPRPIDIDILIYEDLVIDTGRLSIPHPALCRRTFVLTPLTALGPGIRVPALRKTAHELNEALDRRIPLWMGIVNLTPDSFSDGGENRTWRAIESRIDDMVSGGVHMLDLGAESTRPGATPLSPDEEWSRLEPVLARVIEKFASDELRPRISVDTYHRSVAERALRLGVDMINDVGGLTEPEMIELAASHTADFVAMHNLGLPVDPATTLATDRSTVDQIEEWLDARLEVWQASGLDLDRIVFDPGIGFGKNPLQSLEILRQTRRFNRKGLRLLIGHSRKSFMKGLGPSTTHDRDLITIGGSMALCERGVDIIRVHNVADHVTAYRGWAHLQAPG